MSTLSSRIEWLNDPECRFEGENRDESEASSPPPAPRTSTYTATGDSVPHYRPHEEPKLYTLPDDKLNSFNQLFDPEEDDDPGDDDMN